MASNPPAPEEVWKQMVFDVKWLRDRCLQAKQPITVSQVRTGFTNIVRKRLIDYRSGLQLARGLNQTLDGDDSAMLDLIGEVESFTIIQRSVTIALIRTTWSLFDDVGLIDE